MNFVHGGQKCKVCDKRLKTHHLKQHIELVHEKKKPHICHVCAEAFATKNSLMNHIFDSHKEQVLPKVK